MSVTKSSPAASPRKMPRPLGRRPNGMKIDHVLRKAAVLFDKRGYVETTMADLADNLGISKPTRSEEHTSELQSLMRTSYAVFCLKKKNITTKTDETRPQNHD